MCGPDVIRTTLVDHNDSDFSSEQVCKSTKRTVLQYCLLSVMLYIM